MIESLRTAEPDDSPEPGLAGRQAPTGPRDPGPGLDGWLATPVIAIVAVACCAGPPLLGALAATGVGAWLAARGYAIGASALVVPAGLLAWRIRERTRRERGSARPRSG